MIIIRLIKNEQKGERHSSKKTEHRKEWRTITQTEIVRASVPFYLTYSIELLATLLLWLKGFVYWRIAFCIQKDQTLWSRKHLITIIDLFYKYFNKIRFRSRPPFSTSSLRFLLRIVFEYNGKIYVVKMFSK